MNRATGEITVTSVGSDSPVTVRNIRMVWPLLVRRSSSLQGLGDPDHRRQRDQDADEGAEGDPEDVTLDQIHEPGPDAGLLAIAGPAAGTSARNPHSSCDLGAFTANPPHRRRKPCYMCAESHTSRTPHQAPRPAPQAPQSDGKWHDGSEREDRFPALRRARRRRPRGLRRRRPEASRRGARDRAEDQAMRSPGAAGPERFKGKPARR